MKQIIILIATAFISLPVLAQTDTTQVKTDTTSSTEIKISNITFKIKDIPKKNKNAVYDNKFPKVDFLASIGIGVAGLSELSEVQTDNETYVPTSTASVDLDYRECRNYIINGDLLINFSKNIGMMTGIGFEFNRYVFKDKLMISSREGYFLKDSTEYDYYKFKTNYIQIPLMFTIRSKNED